MSADFRMEGRALPVKFKGKGLDATAGVPPNRPAAADVMRATIARDARQIIDPPTSEACAGFVKRKFYVALLEHNEGFSVSCPELPGCHSQGTTTEDALGNIGDAIREYLEVYGEPETRCEIREMEVAPA